MARLTFNQELAVANAISEQIWREQSLIANRMNWNLTFQGFMIAGFALISTADFSAPDRKTLQIIVAFAGIAVALFTAAGVYAAQRQSSYLKKSWDKLVSPRAATETGAKDDEQGDREAGEHEWFPRPFSDKFGSRLGRYPPRFICLVLAVMWGALCWHASTGLERDHSLTFRTPVAIEIVGSKALQVVPADPKAEGNEARTKTPRGN